MISSNGINNVAPVDRNAAIPEVIIWTASEALPVSANSATLLHHSDRLPERGAFFVRQSDKFIELARLLSRSFRSKIWVTIATVSANINVAAWPISRASLSAWSASASAASG